MSELTKPNAPIVGNTFSSSRFRDELIDPLYQNSVSNEDRIAVLENLIASMPIIFKQSTMPSAAKEDDAWYDTTEPLFPIHYVNKNSYTTGNGVATDWIQIKDPRAQTTADGAATDAGTATRIVISTSMPDSSIEGWVWVDNSVGGQNKTYACNATYTSGNGVLPGTGGTQWDLITDTTYALMAAADAGIRDGATNTLIQSGVPDEVDARDSWVDIDDGASYTTTLAYVLTDGLPWANTDDYVTGEFKEESGSYYVAIQDSGPSGVGAKTPSTEPTFWTLRAAYANQTVFKESFWVQSEDPYARQLALEAKNIADGKATIYGGVNPPDPTAPDTIQAGDMWVDPATQQAYKCHTDYGNGAGIDPRTTPGTSQWTAVFDDSAQSAVLLLAGQVDNKVEIFWQSGVPSAGDYKDLWMDMDADDNMYKCDLQYTAIDGDTFATPSSYAEGVIVLYTGSYWRSDVDANTTTPGDPGATWTDTTFDREIIAYNAATVYSKQALVSYSGTIYRNLIDGTVGYQPDTYPEKWEVVTVGTTDIDIFRAERWSWTTDKHARSLADNARAVADSKVARLYQDDAPDHADSGDVWTDTNSFYEDTGLYIQKRCKLAYDFRPSTFPTAQLDTYWEDWADPVAQKTAQDAAAVANAKRTVFVTNSANAVYGTLDADLNWPGPGGGDQLAVSFWSGLASSTANDHAQLGDIWINIYSGEIVERICVDGYTGYDSDLGSPSAWVYRATDAGLTGVLAGYYKRDGSNKITEPIDFDTPDTAGTGNVKDTQDFTGRNSNLTGTLDVAGLLTAAGNATLEQNGYVLYGGTQAVPLAVPAIKSAIVHSEHAQSSFLDKRGGASQNPFSTPNAMTGDLHMGTAGNENKILHVAAGSHADLSTEAVNGDQLFDKFDKSGGNINGDVSLTTLFTGAVETKGLLEFFSSTQGSGDPAFWTARLSRDGAGDLEIVDNAGNARFFIDRSTGQITGLGFNVSSLRSLKENIEIMSASAEQLLNSVDVTTFNYRSDKNKIQKIGLIADDSDERFLSPNLDAVDLYNTVGILIKGFQELSAKITVR